MGLKYSQFRLQKQWLIYALACVVALGVLLRLSNLDQKPYWFDETYSLLRVSGYSEKEVMQALFTGEPIKAGDFLKYQSPASEKSAASTIVGLAQEEPQLPPLYFLLAKGWASGFGSSKLAMRGLSAIVSLLSFPALYWLCLELFAAPLVGWMAMALFAVSPIGLRYAQEIRQYSLWMALILCASALLLRAIRRPTTLNWGLYTAAIGVALYTHLLSGLVILAHGVYVLAIASLATTSGRRLRFNKPLIGYGCSVCISLLCFLPWLWMVVVNRVAVARMTAWAALPLSLSELVQGAGASLCHAFIAWHLRYHGFLIYSSIPIFALILYASYFLYRYTPMRIWIFILSLISVTVLPFLLADLCLGGRRMFSERYFFACYVAIYLAVAYLVVSKITDRSAPFQARLWSLLTALLLSGGILSCVMGSFGKTWWGWSEFDQEIPAIVQKSSHPLVISDMPLGMVMPLARELPPDVEMMLFSGSPQQVDRLKLPDGFSDFFLYLPSDRLLAAVRQNNATDLVYFFRDPATTNQFSFYQVKQGDAS
ncbi:glycosyltransferase family 39 protein [Phormidium tenue FACHB-886]|nr:glycosyltransferase family 39 protein [Phormidium tenue FACHB-886]